MDERDPKPTAQPRATRKRLERQPYEPPTLTLVDLASVATDQPPPPPLQPQGTTSPTVSGTTVF